MIEQGVVERGQPKKQRRPEPPDQVKYCGWLRPAGQQDRTPPNGKGKRERVAKTVGKKNLRNRETNIPLFDLQDVPAIACRRVRHIMLQMDDALGPASAPG